MQVSAVMDDERTERISIMELQYMTDHLQEYIPTSRVTCIAAAAMLSSTDFDYRELVKIYWYSRLTRTPLSEIFRSEQQREIILEQPLTLWLDRGSCLKTNIPQKSTEFGEVSLSINDFETAHLHLVLADGSDGKVKFASSDFGNVCSGCPKKRPCWLARVSVSLSLILPQSLNFANRSNSTNPNVYTYNYNRSSSYCDDNCARNHGGVGPSQVPVTIDLNALQICFSE
jgi:hypothetical protein